MWVRPNPPGRARERSGASLTGRAAILACLPVLPAQHAAKSPHDLATMRCGRWRLKTVVSSQTTLRVRLTSMVSSTPRFNQRGSLQSGLRLPKIGISPNEPVAIHLEHSRVVEAWRFVPIGGLRSPFVALDKYVESTCQHIKPGRWCVCTLTVGQRQSAELEEIRRWSEAKIEIQAVTKTRHFFAVERPRFSRRSLDGELDSSISNPTTHLTVQCAPRNVARRCVRQARWPAAELEHRCAFDSPARAVLLEPTRIVPRAVEPSPKNRADRHVMLPAFAQRFTLARRLNPYSFFATSSSGFTTRTSAPTIPRTAVVPRTMDWPSGTSSPVEMTVSLGVE